MKAQVGSSTLTDSIEAGKQAAQKIKESLSDAKLAFVYASVTHDLKALLQSIAAELPGTQLLGNTTYTGVITPEGYIGGDAFVGIEAFAGDDLVVGTAGLPRGTDPRATGHKLAELAQQAAGKTTPPDYFYLAANPAEEEFYIKGISEVIGRKPLFGGSAADNAIAGEWQLYAGADVFPDGVITAFFYTDKPIKNLFTGAYRETDDVAIITKVANNRTLVEIDGVPAVEKYAQWRDLDPATLAGGNLLVATITSPLGVKDPLGDLIAIRHPMGANPDGSMAIGANLAEKTAVIRMEASVDELIAAASNVLVELRDSLPFKPAAYHLVHCGGRRIAIGERIGEVAEGVKKAAGDVPFILEFTFGEYGFADDGRNAVGGLMLSYTAFAE
jgi:hypothetical protein